MATPNLYEIMHFCLAMFWKLCSVCMPPVTPLLSLLFVCCRSLGMPELSKTSFMRKSQRPLAEVGVGGGGPQPRPKFDPLVVGIMLSDDGLTVTMPGPCMVTSSLRPGFGWFLVCLKSSLSHQPILP